MGEKRVVVPQGMKAVAAEAWREMFGHGSHHGEIDAILRPVLAWLDAKLEEFRVPNILPWQAGRNSAINDIRRMFLAPDPVLPESVSAVAIESAFRKAYRGGDYDPDHVWSKIIEAYERDRKAAKQ